MLPKPELYPDWVIAQECNEKYENKFFSLQMKPVLKGMN